MSEVLEIKRLEQQVKRLEEEVGALKKAAAVLRESEEKYRVLMNDASDMILLADLQGRILEVNRQAEAVFGYSKAEFINLTVPDLHPPELLPQILAIFAEARETGKNIFISEIYILTKDRRKVPVEITGSLVEYGGQKAVQGIVRDLTERYRVAEALKEREERFYELAEMLPEIVYETDAEGFITFANKKGLEKTGFTHQDILEGFNILDLVPSSEQEKIKRNFQRIISGENPEIFEYTIRRKDGSTFPAIIRRSAKMHKGQIVGMRGILIDVTDLKMAQQRLADSEQTYRTLTENLPCIVYRVNIKESWRMDFFNEMLTALTGYTAQELKHGDVCSLDPHILFEDRGLIVEEVKAAIAQNRAFDIQYRFKHKNASVRFFWEKGRVVSDAEGNAQYIDGVIFDVTEQKEAAQALQQSEKLFRYITENMLDMVSLVDAQGNIQYASPSHETVLGYSPPQLLGRSILELLHPDDVTRVKTMLLSGFKKLTAGRVEYRYLHASGRYLWLESSGKVLCGEEGEVTGGVFVSCDITERKRAEEQLQISERRYRELYQANRDGFARGDLAGNFLECNSAFLNMLGYTKEEMIGKDLHDLTPEKWWQTDEKIYREQVFTRGFSDYYEKENIKKDGSIFPIGLRVYAIKDEYGQFTGTWAWVSDLTERKQLEEERARASKLESIGLLAGGIAHDFNNILTGILGNISLARLCFPSEEDIMKVLAEAERACVRATDLTRQLLTFAKGGAPVKKITSATELVSESIGLTLRGSKSRSVLNLPNDLWPMEVDAGQISQVLNNIIINADQAMPGGGILSLRGENLRLESNAVSSLPGGNYIKLSIQDQGIGIPKEHFEKIFDPYFSTKQKGSGLGLAVAYSIIKKHGGSIEIESELGQGSTFSIYLPAVPQAEVSSPEVKEEIVTGRGKILLMDDEEIVQTIGSRMLVHLGYQAVCVPDGQTAIARYQEAQAAGEPFAAVIMDLTIPGGMGGEEAIKKLLAIDPRAKVVVSSGYSEDTIMSDFRRFGFRGVIAKPYTFEGLSQTLAKVIQEK